MALLATIALSPLRFFISSHVNHSKPWIWLGISSLLFGSGFLLREQWLRKTTAVTPCLGDDPAFNLQFLQTDLKGRSSPDGKTYGIAFNPRSPQLDFKVNLGLAHPLYDKDADEQIRRQYRARRFHELIADENAKLNGKLPIAAINADYIDVDNTPQGLNISRGVEYSGEFHDRRSSFGISGGEARSRVATIQVGRRQDEALNYNLVGGNGRFYQDGKFKDICEDLGEYACRQATNRSMAVITRKGYVLFLVNNELPQWFGEDGQVLYPDKFAGLIEGVTTRLCLGAPQDGLLFDGGISPGFYYDGKLYVENSGAIGSVFLIHQK
jgi:Phosphodiester glycosidase